MPPLPAVPAVIQIALKYTFGSDNDIINRFFMTYAGTAPTTAQLTALAASIATAYGADLKSYANPDVILVNIEITDLASSSGAQANAVQNIAGTRSGASFNPGVAVVLQNKIARRYRGGHSRTYLPFLNPNDLNGPSQWTTATINALATAWGTFIAAITAASWSGGSLGGQVNVSYYHGFTNVTSGSGRARPRPTLRATPVVDAVTSNAVNIKPGSQRRRNLQGS